MINKIKSYFIMLKAARYQGLGDFKRVIELSLNALELNPRSLAAFIMLADDYPRLGKYDEAKALLSKALKVYPKDSNLNYINCRAVIYRKEKII